LQIAGEEQQPILVGEHDHVFFAPTVAGKMPHQRHQGCRVVAGHGPAGDFIASPGALQQCCDVDPLQRGGQQPHGRGHGGASADPVPHGKTLQPALAPGQFVQLAVNAGYGNGMAAKIKVVALIGGPGFQHAVAGLLGGAALGDDDGQGSGQVAAQFVQDPVKAVRIGVVQKVRFQGVAGAGEGIGHELGTQGRTADADDQQAGERFTVLAGCFTGMDATAEGQNLLQASPNLASDGFFGRQGRVTQPVVTDHATLIRVGHGAGLQCPHLRKGLLHGRLHAPQKSIVMVHSADVERQTDFGAMTEEAAVAIPGGGWIHG